MPLYTMKLRPLLFCAVASFLSPAGSLHAAPGTVQVLGYLDGNGTLPQITNVVKLAGGARHFVFLYSTGQQGGWGQNWQGELNIPANPFGGTLTEIAAGDARSAGVWSTGHVTWSSQFPPSLPSGVTALSLFGFQTVARLSDGTVAVHGGPAAPAGLTGVTKVAAGDSHALALKTDGTVTAWGSNFYNQLNVPAGLSGVTAIACGQWHSLALKSDGTVVAWGAGTAGSSGWPHYGQSIVPPGLSGVTAIAAGYGHSVALKSDGSLVCWGDNSYGQCTVPATLRNVQAIAAGENYTVVTALAVPDIAAGVDNFPSLEGARVEFLTNTGTAQTRTFYISNQGTAPLTGLAVTKSGPDAARFTIGALSKTTLVPADFVTFTVSYAPTAAGNSFAELHIASNDPDEAPWDAVLSGRSGMGAVAWGGDPFHPEYGLSGVPVAAADVISVACDATWSGLVRSDGTVTGWGGSMETSPRVTTLVPGGAWPGAVQACISAASVDAPGGSVLGRDGSVHEWSPSVSALGAQILPPSAGVRRIAAGQNHGLALKSDGSLHQWGGIAAMPAGLSYMQDIAAGTYHSVVLTTEGDVYAWGSNLSGESSVPPGLKAVDIAAGSNFTVALKPDGTVTVFGAGSTTDFAPPAGLNNVIAVEAAGGQIVAIKRDGSFVRWGSSGPPAWMTRPSALAAGSSHGLVLMAPVPDLQVSRDGREWVNYRGLNAGWSAVGTARSAGSFTLRNAGGSTLTLALTKPGANPGDFTVGGFPASLAPNATATVTVNFTPAAIGHRHCILRIATNAPTEPVFDIPLSGRTPMYVSAWGYDLGAGMTRVPRGLNDAIAVAAGGYHSLALRSNGTVVAWGANQYGQAAVPAGLTGVTAIAANAYDSIALRSNGAVAHWGSRAAALPPGLSGVQAITAGTEHFLALKTNGAIVAWGSNNSGESTVPTDFTEPATAFDTRLALAAGRSFSAMLAYDAGTGPFVYGWGRNDANQLGAAGGSFLSISAGDAHMLGLEAGSTVRAWGKNDNGQTSVPAGLSGVRDVSAGGFYSLALRHDGTLAGWGNFSEMNYAPAGFGKLGGLSAGYYHALGLTLAFPDIAVQEPGLFLHQVNVMQLASAGLTGSEVRTILITNDGETALTGLNVTLSGADASQFTITQPPVTTLAPGAATVCTVRFTPSSVNAKTALLQIASNDPDENPFRIELQGDSNFTPVQAWRANWWSKTEIFNTGRSANTADGDGDGLNNMLECAFGTIPVQHDRRQLRYTGPAAGGGTLVERGQPIVLYEKAGTVTTIRGVWIRRKNHAALGLVYSPEFAANPNAFTASTTTPQVLASDANYEVVAVTFPATVPGGVPKFFRVRVRIPNPD